MSAIVRLFILVLAFTVAIGATSASAQPSPTPDSVAPPHPYALGVAISGGASLGSFEGGALYYSTAFLNANPTLGQVRVITGTSAGSINGVLTVLATCSEATPVTTDSPFFKVWTPIGIDGLFDPKRASPTAALTREAGLSQLANSVRAAWTAGFPTSCDIAVGIPVTRIEPQRSNVDSQGTLSILRAVERFVVRIRGRGRGKAPSITNYVDVSSSTERAVLSTDANGEVSFESLLDVVFASSGIPLAFAAVKIPHCFVGGDHPKSDSKQEKPAPVVCLRDKANVAEFVDGGFLNNQPLRLAARIGVSGLDPAGPSAAAHLRDVPDLLFRDFPDSARLFAIDPAEMTWATKPAEKAKESSMLGILKTFVPNLLESAYSADLQALVEELPNVSDRIRVLQSDWPTASAPLANFFGFFERDFRVFDFYLGMHEARRRLDAWVDEAGDKRPRIVYPEDALAENGGAAASWERYRCLRTALTQGKVPEHCQAPQHANFRALMQVTVERAYAHCRTLPQATLANLKRANTELARSRCVAAAGGAAPPELIGSSHYDHWMYSGEEQPHEHMIRRLAAHGFVFRDLDVGAGASPMRVRERVAELIGTIGSSLAGAQPDHQLVWKSLARVGVQSLTYRAPEHAFHVIAGGSWELGWSATVPNSRWAFFRPSAVVTIDGITSILNQAQTPYVAFNPAVGFELEPIPLSNESFQFRAGLRGGFQFASADNFWPNRATPVAGIPVSRPALSAHAAGILYQWVRVQVGGAWFPPFEGEKGTFVIRPMLGLEIDTPL